MKLLKQSFHLIMLILTVAGLALCGLFLKKQAENYTIVLTDLYGDKANLQAIKIKGTVADDNHRQEFEISDGNVNTKFFATTEEERKSVYSTPMSELFSSVDYSYEPLELPTEEKKITAKEAAVTVRIQKSQNGSFTLKTNMTVKNGQSEYSFEYKNINGKIQLVSGGGSFHDMPTNIDTRIIRQNTKTGRTYLFTKTGHDCTGFGGAYDITEQIKSTYEDSERIELENIAPIDLKDGSVRIIDMQITGDIMVFFTFENGEIILKRFDMTSNRFRDDINLGYFKFADGSCNIRRYSSADDRYMIIAFEMNEKEVYLNDNRLYAFVFDRETDEVVFSKAEDYREVPFNIYTNVNMKYKDNKLFLLKENSVYLSMNEISYEQLRITVLDKNATLYDGIVISGTSDDARYNNTNRLQTALDYRYYFNVSLE
jgi:hypothetical protein